MANSIGQTQSPCLIAGVSQATPVSSIPEPMQGHQGSCCHLLWVIFKHSHLKDLHSISLFCRRVRPPLGMARSVAVASSVLGTGIIVWWAWQLGVLEGAVPSMFPWGPGDVSPEMPGRKEQVTVPLALFVFVLGC